MTVTTLNAAEIALNFAEISDIGGRQSNQDAQQCAVQDDFAIFVVADGAGGHEGGELAAKTVSESVVSSFTNNTVFSPEVLKQHIDSAIARVQEVKQAQPGLKDMSATVATVLLDLKNGQSLWAHMGDTRIYLFRRGKVQRITKDHSIAQQFVDAGFWAYDSIRNHPQRNRLFADRDLHAVVLEPGNPVLDQGSHNGIGAVMGRLRERKFNSDRLTRHYALVQILPGIPAHRAQNVGGLIVGGNVFGGNSDGRCGA